MISQKVDEWTKSGIWKTLENKMSNAYDWNTCSGNLAPAPSSEKIYISCKILAREYIILSYFCKIPTNIWFLAKLL